MISKRTCPECGSESVEYIEGENEMFMCRDCGYSGSDFQEEKITQRETSSIPLLKKQKKGAKAK